MEPTKTQRIDSLGRVTEPLAVHLWEKSWEKPSPAPDIDREDLV